MLAEEMKRYDSVPQYHVMFEEMGVADPIRRFDAESSKDVPAELLPISSANPSDHEVMEVLERFSRAGVDLPIIYPYVSGDDSYRVSLVERLASSVA